jgi:hypothetical protein
VIGRFGPINNYNVRADILGRVCSLFYCNVIVNKNVMVWATHRKASANYCYLTKHIWWNVLELRNLITQVSISGWVFFRYCELGCSLPEFLSRAFRKERNCFLMYVVLGCGQFTFVAMLRWAPYAHDRISLQLLVVCL